MLDFSRHVIPVAGSVRCSLVADRQDQLPLGDDSHVVRVVAVGFDERAGWIAGEQDLAPLPRQLVGVEWPSKSGRASISTGKCST